MDRPGFEVVGDFPPTSLEQDVSGNWATQSTLGRAHPIVQFVSGALETWSFEARVWAQHQGLLGIVSIPTLPFFGDLNGDIGDKVQQITDLARINEDLGRPEVFLFTLVSVGLGAFVGALLGIAATDSQVSVQVVVRSVGGIRFDTPRGDGTLRGATFKLDLARYEPFDPNALTAPEAESLVTPVRTGETYEHIGARVHGDPLLGEALRRRNPETPILSPGDLVHVPSDRILRREISPLVPASLFLKPGTAQRENMLNAFEARGVPVSTHILLKDWS